MIREKEKKKKSSKPLSQIIKEYLRTISLSFIFALLVTTLLSIHARNEMIKNLYLSKEEKVTIDRTIAQKIISNSDLTKSIENSPYSICMQVGQLYEAAEDYSKAEYAYHLATKKAKKGNFTPLYKLIEMLVAQEKFDEANAIINDIVDVKNKTLIKFKTRAYLTMGDKFYSVGKFLKAAKAYEKANFYYNKFSKKDTVIVNSIKKRLVSSYTETADVIVKNGLNSDAVVFLKKAEKYDPEDYKIKYKLAIVYSDLDPILAIEYFEKLMSEKPQLIDYTVFNKTLIKAANISELEGNYIKAKYYRYKNHSLDLYVNNKVVYKNDINVNLKDINIKKYFFKYKIKATFELSNVSSFDINTLKAEFVLKQQDKIKEIINKTCAKKSAPLLSNSIEPKFITVEFGKNIFTKKELEQYSIELYLYKDDKFKTLISTYKLLPEE